MTDREAMQMALEALEGIHRVTEYPKIQPAVTALRAQLERQEPQLKRIHPLDIPLEVFVEDLSARPRNIINAEMLYFTHSGDEYIKPPFTVRHLMMFSRKELRKWPNLGKRSLNEIEEILRNCGLQLWGEHDERSLRLLREHSIYALRAQLKNQEKTSGSPVAWAVYYKGGGSKSLHWHEQHSPDGDATIFNAVPLYTHPPAAQRKPLTKEMVHKLWSNTYDDTTDRAAFEVFARAIEAAHGIKEEP